VSILLTQLFILYFAFYLSTYVKSLAFYFLRSDNEDPKRDATTAPSAETMATDEPSLQEVDPVVKSPKAPKAPLKKVVATHGSKRLKKSTDAGASLEAHQSTSSSDDVRVYPGIFVVCSLCDLHTYMFVLNRS
jgi:hypothetical protein